MPSGSPQTTLSDPDKSKPAPKDGRAAIRGALHSPPPSKESRNPILSRQMIFLSLAVRTTSPFRSTRLANAIRNRPDKRNDLNYQVSTSEAKRPKRAAKKPP